MYQCDDCDYRSARIWCINRHRTNKHGSKQHEKTAPAINMQRNHESAPTNSHHEQSEQQRVPFEYYQNIKNQLDQATNYNLQWQDAYQNLHNLLDTKHHEQSNQQQSQVNKIEIQEKKLPKLRTINDPNYLRSGSNIEYILQNRKEFLGCFPSDNLPPFPTQFPKSMIINTDKATEAGEHWLGLVLTEKKCFYFDPFGLPIIEQSIRDYLRLFYPSKKIIYSNNCIQHVTSTFCGAYCVCFILWVKNKVTFNNFFNHFKNYNLLANDKELQNIVKDMVFKV